MYARLLRLTIPKARVYHRCIWCGETILKGVIYLNMSIVWQGKIQTQKWHDECYGKCEGEFTPYSNPRGENPDAL